MRSWCFDSIATEDDDGELVYDREYGSAELREVVQAIVGNGIYGDSSTNMQVIAGGGMNVSVRPGACWINGAYGVVDEAETLAIEANTSGSSRTDIVIARFDTSLAYRSIRLMVATGSTTLIRNDSVYDLQLARINVRSGATTITQSDITDTRFNKSVCGIVTGAISQIDTTTLFEQYQAQFDSFMNNLETNLEGDTAGNLLSKIEDNEAVVTETKNNLDSHLSTYDPHGVAPKFFKETVTLTASKTRALFSMSQTDTPVCRLIVSVDGSLTVNKSKEDSSRVTYYDAVYSKLLQTVIKTDAKYPLELKVNNADTFARIYSYYDGYMLRVDLDEAYVSLNPTAEITIDAVVFYGESFAPHIVYTTQG